ncbi:Scr1 family TA system antitoxin-like transcriptional regulator, partial [Streptomyces reticuliscabiei]|uniref:Scr1 family TA system antitoxin-like transcriptional regulator n=1 Tax=Streptomyces reticuliscabiei TaxID=146821 RepID=UPI0032B140E7
MQNNGHDGADVRPDQEHDNIGVRVIPFKAGAFPGAGQAVIYTEGPLPQLDTVELDSAHGPEFTHGQSQLDRYRAHLDWTEAASLTRSASRDFIHGQEDTYLTDTREALRTLIQDIKAG